jgi:hypothetical protein
VLFAGESYKLGDMKKITSFIAATLVLGSIATGFAADAKTDKAKAYPLDKCIVSDEKLGGDMGEPFVFVHDGQEIKLCCKSCQKDFNKNPAKFMKKLAKAEKAEKK